MMSATIILSKTELRGDKQLYDRVLRDVFDGGRVIVLEGSTCPL